MARIPELTKKEQIPEQFHAVYDSIQGTRGGVRGPFAILLHSPEVAGRTAHLGAYLRFAAVLNQAERELVIITVASHWDCKVEWAIHSTIARQAGVSAQAIETVRTNYSAERLPEGEALLVRYTRELLEKHQVSKPLFDAALAKYGRQGVVDLTALIGYYAMLACTLNAFEVEPAPNAAG